MHRALSLIDRPEGPLVSLPWVRGAIAALFLLGGARAAAADQGAAAIAVADQEIGARLAAQLGAGGTTPGGLRLGGLYLYRMSPSSWLEADAAVSFGAGGAECFRDRDDAVVCEHSVADGFSLTGGAGGRWFPAAREGGFQPFLRAGAALALASFGDDEVLGLGVPLYAGGGGRIRVTDQIAVGGEAVLYVGPAWFGGGVGLSAYSALLVQFGVDFEL